jgi:uncharacterized protein
MKKLSIENVFDIGIGCAILGSGGGSDTGLCSMMAKKQMEKTGPVRLISYSELKPDDVIMSIGTIGAPSAETEKLLNGKEFEIMFEYIRKSLNKKVSVVMPLEIGGGSGIIPIIEASKLNLPVLDADTMGRAFPEAQMTSCNLMGVCPSPGFITDCLGNTTVIYASNTHTLEKIGRQICVAMGSIGAFAYFPLTAADAERCTFPKSISKAFSLGKAIREARESGKDPVDTLLNICKGKKIGSGKVTDIDRVIDRGFLQGIVTIQDKKEKMELHFKNEYLVAKNNGKIVATTPDILMLIEQQTGMPIDSPKLQYGLKVHLIALPAPALWTTPAGLQLVGPRHFGYETDYHPISSQKVNNHVKEIFHE